MHYIIIRDILYYNTSYGGDSAKTDSNIY